VDFRFVAAANFNPMKMNMAAKENETGALANTSGNTPDDWRSAGFSLLRDIGRVAADNLTRRDTEERTQQSGSDDREQPWFKQPAIMIGGGVAALILIIVLLKRR
jgi:hypothetical protein